jgi:hypothetical protein
LNVGKEPMISAVQGRGTGNTEKEGKCVADDTFGRLATHSPGQDDEEMPHQNDERVTYLARVNFRNDRRVFGIKRRDRRSHTYIIGKTGTGKSTLLANMIQQDVDNGEGLTLVDPHGDLVAEVLHSFPAHRRADLIYFNAPDPNLTLRFNPLRQVEPAERSLAASDLIDVFKKIWAESWGPRLEHLLRNSLLAVLELPEPALFDLLRLLTDREFRRGLTLHMPLKEVREFWLREYEGYPERFRAEAIAPLQNKLGAFLSNPILSRILSGTGEHLNLREVIDTGKVLLVNLSKGKIGEDSAALFGALLVARLGRMALRRAAVPEPERRDHFLYLDEFHSFANLSLSTMLSELRKYRLNLILAHQFLTQLEAPVKDAILGNVGTMISFRVGAADAEILAQEFEPVFNAGDLVNLPNYHCYLKLMVDGMVTTPFSAVTQAESPDRFSKASLKAIQKLLGGD